jgi:hypothetical protein
MKRYLYIEVSYLITFYVSSIQLFLTITPTRSAGDLELCTPPIPDLAPLWRLQQGRGMQDRVGSSKPLFQALTGLLMIASSLSDNWSPVGWDLESQWWMSVKILAGIFCTTCATRGTMVQWCSGSVGVAA